MAKPFAKRFYNSKQWKQCRAAYIEKVNGMCEHEECGQPGYILHHKVELNPKNINDPWIALNHEVLQFLCLYHHNLHHMGTAEPITARGTAFDEYGNLILVGEGFKRG